jgi:hypothetical protein
MSIMSRSTTITGMEDERSEVLLPKIQGRSYGVVSTRHERGSKNKRQSRTTSFPPIHAKLQ